MANANEFVITEHRCEMCKSYGPAAECTMNIEGKVIARFWLCIGCQQEMLETEIAYERREVSSLLAKLNKAIEADPDCVSEHHKELWRKQAKAMQEYVDVLSERIKDLIDNG